MADIDYISKIDFSKGFKSFYVKWSLKTISAPKNCPDFQTAIKTSDGNVSFSWQLATTGFDDDDDIVWFGLCLRSTDKLVPAIFRIALSSQGKEQPLYDQSRIFIFGLGQSDCGSTVSIDEASKFMDDNELIFHCWIDIPLSIIAAANHKKIEGDQNRDRFFNDASLRMKSVGDFGSDMGKLFNDIVRGQGGFADCADETLVITNKDKEEIRRFPCHSALLAARSPVFECMFGENQWKENAGQNERLIEIDDIDEKTMEFVLNHIYTGCLPDKSIDHKFALNLVYAADKYNLAHLKNWCISILIAERGTIAERLEQLVLADRHQLNQLRSVCVAQLAMDFLAFFEDVQIFKSVPVEFLTEIAKASAKKQFEMMQFVFQSA